MPQMPKKCLIIGCGYVGLPLALRLIEQGHEATGWVHSPASARALEDQPLHRVIVGSVADEQIWNQAVGAFGLIIHCASSSRGGSEAYEQVFHQGVTLMQKHQPQARRLFVSSTSVYGQTQGEIVTEESLTEPTTETGGILRETEKSACAAGTIVVRSAGIYGPGRGVLFEKFKRGEAVIEGDGSRWLNQIHQRDIVSAIVHLAELGQEGHIYNACDNTPVMLRDFYAWCSEFMQRPLPPYGPVNPNRKRGLTSKRIANAKLRASGWKPIYSSFREGLKADHSPK